MVHRIGRDGGKIKYREGKNNIRANALSRIKTDKPQGVSTNTSVEPLSEDDEIIQTYLHISGMVVSDHEALMQEDGCRKQVEEIHCEGA